MTPKYVDESSSYSRSSYLPYVFMCKNPAWKSLINRLGWWMVLCPPIGWLMALGYRKDVAISIYDQSIAPPVPTLGWHSDYKLFVQGVGALLVMAFYFTPALLCIWAWGKWNGLSSCMHLAFWLDTDLWYYLACSFILIPITLGGVAGMYYFMDASFELTPTQMLLAFIMLNISVFIIPSGYMQVGQRGRWIDACNLKRGLSWICTHPKIYLMAWWRGLYVSMLALSMLWRAPWGLAWCYISIVWIFNRSYMTESSPYHPIHNPPTLELFMQQITSPPHIYYKWNCPIPIWWTDQGIEND